MKLTLAIIVCIGLYTAIADSPENSDDKEVERKYQEILEKAEEYAVSPEMNRAYNLRLLTWAKSDSVNEEFKLKCIEAFNERHPAQKIADILKIRKYEAAYDVLTERITNLFFRVDETSQSKRVKPDINETDGEVFNCPICLDPVKLEETHCMAATKCGHLFGKSCLELWHSSCPKRCPTCSKKQESSDIRRLFDNKIVVLDNKLDIERELDRLDLELNRLRCNHFKCPFCNFTINSEDKLFEHQLQHHKELFKPHK